MGSLVEQWLMRQSKQTERAKGIGKKQKLGEQKAEARSLVCGVSVDGREGTPRPVASRIPMD